MLTLFLRAILMYALVFAVIRLTGKRQVADLQPFDLLITLLIADLAGCAIADTAIPLVYSVVPIIGMYLVQQLVTWLCMKNARVRRVVCGSPVILVSDGAVCESAMRQTNYTLIDLLDQLRSKGIFDLGEVAYAILETNGSMSVLPKPPYCAPTVGDMGLQNKDAGLGYMLILDGELCHDAIQTLGLNGKRVQRMAKSLGADRVQDVFYLFRSFDGALSMQLKERAGGGRKVREGQDGTNG